MNREQRAKSREQRTVKPLVHYKSNINILHIALFFFLSSFFFLLFGCRSMAITAEEYFSIGMAYYDLGRFEDAERWLNRARQADRTYAASQYNLGRIAFERNRFDEAANQFEGILRRDPDNVLALRAAAYTRIRMGDIERAQTHYSRLLRLVPESADDGYNHALVLFAMNRYSEAEQTLERYPFAMTDNRDMQLLFARSQGRQNKVEAIDSLANWLKTNKNNRARFELAQVLEYHEFYARALEEYRETLTEIDDNSADPARTDIRFAIANVLLIAERDSNAGITEMQGAVDDGFKDISAIEEIINSGRVTGANLNSLRTIVDNLRRAELAEQERERERAEQEERARTEQEETDLETDPETGTE